MTELPTSRGGILTPCTGVCTLDRRTKRCQGCQRTKEEIARWRGMAQEERRRIMTEELPKRRPSTS